MGEGEAPRFRSPLAAFEVPRQMAEPVVRALRAFNTAVDFAFYDVPDLVADLAARDTVVRTMQGHEDKPPSRLVDLDALTNPEGALLLIDAKTEPYVHRFTSVDAYLLSEHLETRRVEVATVTGVGSSAYGAAAFGWQVSTCLERPVLAIVPGYGLADMVQQALGGWFAFGLHDYLGVKPAVQRLLATVAPASARIGRELPMSIPDREEPVFEHGSGSSDVLHALLDSGKLSLKVLVGHSKGALVIKNAIRSLPPAAHHGLTFVSLGCPVAEEFGAVSYHQFLGVFDALGQANAWGNWPSAWPLASHTTNPRLALPLDICALLKDAVGVAHSA